MNSCGNDFEGGHFHFQDGKHETIMPMAGDVLMYTADSRNIHSVDEVTGGERLTLTLWFSRDSSHDEDTKLIALLSQRLSDNSNNTPCSYLPSPASSSMYWFTPNQTSKEDVGFDIRLGRLHALGFSVYSEAMDSHADFPNLLDQALQLTRGNQLFHLKFVNIMHALQVVQFYNWKASQNPTFLYEDQAGKVVQLSPSQLEKTRSLKSVFQKYAQLSETVFGNITFDEKALHSFDWNNLSAAISKWEDYSGKLHNELLISFPQWKIHQSICTSDFDSNLE